MNGNNTSLQKERRNEALCIYCMMRRNMAFTSWFSFLVISSALVMMFTAQKSEATTTATTMECTPFIVFKLPCSGSTWFGSLFSQQDTTMVFPQLLPAWNYLSNPAPYFANKMWETLDCYQERKGKKKAVDLTLAGFTINPLSTKAVVDFKELVTVAAPKHPRVMKEPKLVQYVRTNVVKQAISFLSKVGEVEGPCSTTKKGRIVVNANARQIEELCDKNKTFTVDLWKFAGAVAAEAQLRVDFDNFMASFHRDYVVVEYEKLQMDSHQEMRILYERLGAPESFFGLKGEHYAKKSREDLSNVIINIDQLRQYIQDLDINEVVCPLLQMLEAPHHEVFSSCDYVAVVRSIQESTIYDKNVTGYFDGLRFSAGRNLHCSSKCQEASEAAKAMADITIL